MDLETKNEIDSLKKEIAALKREIAQLKQALASARIDAIGLPLNDKPIIPKVYPRG